MGAVVMLIAAVVAAAAVVGIVGLVVAMVVAAVVLAVKVLPLFLIGYGVVKLIQRSERPGRGALTRADGAWLDVR
jgi:hypothetical protein